MPGETGATVVTTLVCFFYFAHEASGALATRHSPRPLSGEGYMDNPGANRAAGRLRRAFTQYRRPCERRDPYAVSRVLRDADRRLSRNNADPWLWVPAFAGTTSRPATKVLGEKSKLRHYLCCTRMPLDHAAPLR